MKINQREEGGYQTKDLVVKLLLKKRVSNATFASCLHFDILPNLVRRTGKLPLCYGTLLDLRSITLI